MKDLRRIFIIFGVILTYVVKPEHMSISLNKEVPLREDWSSLVELLVYPLMKGFHPFDYKSCPEDKINAYTILSFFIFPMSVLLGIPKIFAALVLF